MSSDYLVLNHRIVYFAIPRPKHLFRGGELRGGRKSRRASHTCRTRGVGRKIRGHSECFWCILIHCDQWEHLCNHLTDVSRSFCVHATLWGGLTKDPDENIES